MRRRLTGKDQNQAEIVGVLRDVGASIIDTSHMGNGFPDLVVGYRGVIYLLEVKNNKTFYGRKGFNENQKAWNARWAGPPPIIVRSQDDALKAIGAI
jgi:Holliday junction resolvase